MILNEQLEIIRQELDYPYAGLDNALPYELRLYIRRLESALVNERIGTMEKKSIIDEQTRLIAELRRSKYAHKNAVRGMFDDNQP